MQFVAGHSKPGMFVELRAEMNVLVAINTCRHPLDPRAVHRPGPVRLSIRRVLPPTSSDVCRVSRPENVRGFVLTERYHL
jgi:uncharacterized protein YcgI (DUF1989 family)